MKLYETGKHETGKVLLHWVAVQIVEVRKWNAEWVVELHDSNTHVIIRAATDPERAVYKKKLQ